MPVGIRAVPSIFQRLRGELVYRREDPRGRLRIRSSWTPRPVTVRDFRRLVDTTSYVTDAQTAGFGYAVVGENLRQVNGGAGSTR